jgi:DNA-binding NarL/FixJ family response regulator
MKILVVDDHALVREGMRQVLKGLEDEVQVLEAATCAQAFEVAASQPDLDMVLLDYHLPDMNGLAALDTFGQKHPELPVILVSGSASPEIMRQVLSRGAAGFIPKSSKSEVLLSALGLVMAGEVYVPPELLLAPSPAKSAGSGASVATGLDGERPPPELTPRQIEVLQHLLDGRSNREIGSAMHLSEETIKNHVTSILRIFEVQTRTQAVIAATRYGFKSSQPAGL